MVNGKCKIAKGMTNKQQYYGLEEIVFVGRQSKRTN